MSRPPERIVCLSAEVADWLWRIGAWEQVAGVTAFFSLPTEAPPKPVVSGFSTGNLEWIERVNPDLIITFSDVQATLASELIRRGFPVLATNQRTLGEIESTLALIARIVNRPVDKWLEEFRNRLTPVEPTLDPPRVYFEEWNDPLIYGIAWVGELIQRAGGRDIFGGSPDARAARQRIALPEQVCEANPEIIIASWCGKPVIPAEFGTRPGWSDLKAVREKRVFALPGEDILQPGFRLVYGYERLKQILLEARTMSA